MKDADKALWGRRLLLSSAMLVGGCMASGLRALFAVLLWVFGMKFCLCSTEKASAAFCDSEKATSNDAMEVVGTVLMVKCVRAVYCFDVFVCLSGRNCVCCPSSKTTLPMKMMWCALLAAQPLFENSNLKF